MAPVAAPAFGAGRLSDMRVLVTNDDGVESAGLHALVRALVADGLDVVVAAPDRDMSGSGAAIGQFHVDQHIDASSVELPGLAGVTAYAVGGPPGLCVLAARLGGFGPFLVSGRDPGGECGSPGCGIGLAEVGRDILEPPLGRFGVTFLHQWQREVKTTMHRGQPVEYIEATAKDVELAQKLIHEVLGRSLDDMPAQTRRLLLLIDGMVTAECEREKV